MKTDIQISVLFINDDTCEQVSAALSRLEGVQLSMHDAIDTRPLKLLGKEGVPDILIIEINGQRDQDLRDVETILKEYPDKLTVFVTYKDGDMATMRRLMRAGVKDVFPQPLQVQEVVVEVSEIISSKRRRAGIGADMPARLAVFMNAKGGCGASTLAVNTAVEMASREPGSVALVDFDVQFGVDAMYLDLNPRSTLLDALREPERIDSVFVKALMEHHASGLDVLASPGRLDVGEHLNEDAVTRLIAALRDIYDFVILDLPRLFVPWSLFVIQQANPLVIALQNNLAAIRDTKLILEALGKQGVPHENIELIVNRVTREIGNIQIEQIRKTLEWHALQLVHNDYETALAAQDQGVPVSAISSRSHLSRDIQSVVDRLLARYGRTVEPRKGLLGRLFGHHD
jgi:pilus assembly protein CpaE